MPQFREGVPPDERWKMVVQDDLPPKDGWPAGYPKGKAFP
eukprot:SAG31_NODE_42126_length_273_cov_0.586207_1_plen_39_part_10